jgi:hypothetical protein
VGEGRSADEVIEELYAVPPDRFIAARARAVAAARAAGDPAAVRELAGLRRPTMAAWLLNLLAIRRPASIDRLLDLAAALRIAAHDGDGHQLRELSAARRALVTALLGQACALARAEDPGRVPASLPLAEVEATLRAALVDVDVAERVRAGRLLRAVRYASSGEPPRPRLRLIKWGVGENASGDHPVEAVPVGRARRSAT